MGLLTEFGHIGLDEPGLTSMDIRFKHRLPSSMAAKSDTRHRFQWANPERCHLRGENKRRLSGQFRMSNPQCRIPK
ncbi:MAG: hypothetical protein JEZ11_12530 [Desulfobacterales bacterium]|nr:hypothetical protein [Desulfobacterales bacterium]